jgi:hypothetical protein
MTRDPPRFVLTLQPKPNVDDPIRMLRRALRLLLRQCGLSCVGIKTARRGRRES